MGLAETKRLLGRRGKVLALYEPALADLPGLEQYPEAAELPAAAARLRIFAYLAETFEALAEDEPLALLLDDLQWADELTLGFLQYWQRALAAGAYERVELLIVGAYRAEEVDAGPAEVEAAHASPLRRLIEGAEIGPVALGRLEEAAVGSMVGDMLALAPPPALFVGHLARHSEGNPFFVAEYLRAAVAAELLWRDRQGVWQVAEPAGARGDAASAAATAATYEALPLPGTLRELVTRRLDGLDRAARKILDAAAVLGREAELELVGPMLRLGDQNLYDALNELLRRQVLEVPAPGQLRFVHDKIREVAYAGLRKDRRKKLHRAAATSITSASGPAVPDNRMAALGHHWDQAGQPDQARFCYLAAARHATVRYDHAEAERLYRAYLHLVEEPSAESITARNELGERVLTLRSRYEEALSEHRQAVEEARSLGDRGLEGQGLYLMGDVYRRTGQIELARQLQEQALTIYRDLGDRTGEGKVLGNLAVLHKEQGRMEEARQLSEQALAISRKAGVQHFEGHVLGNLAGLHEEQGRTEEARQLNERALILHREAGDRPGEAAVLNNLANLQMFQGRMEEARQLHEHALILYREVGDRTGEGKVLGNLAILHSMQGRMEEARPLFEQALAIFREAGDRRQEGISLSNLATVHREQGRVEQARQLHEQALTVHRELGNTKGEGIEATNLAILHGEQGRMEQARQLFEQALVIHRQLGNRPFEGLVLGFLAFAELIVSGNPQQAALLAEQGEHILMAGGHKVELGKLLCVRCHIALAAGRNGPEFLDRAQGLAEESGAGPESELGMLVTKLRRAVEASEAGEHHRLFRGQLIEDIPEGLRRWLRETGQLSG